MATPDECKIAITKLAARMAGSPDNAAGGLDRIISATITDLGIAFHGHLHDGVLDDVAEGEAPGAKIRMSMTSDDLVALADGELAFGPAWMSGRLKVHASFTDLLRLRSLA